MQGQQIYSRVHTAVNRAHTAVQRIIRPYISLQQLDVLLPIGFLFANLYIQNYHLGKLLNVFTDEGCYVYPAQLMAQGAIPYKDFFLAHPFYLMLLPALSFVLFSVNMNIFHFVYTVWFFSALIPLYFLISKATNSRLAATGALLLFSTYQELVQWGAHQFDLRQTSLPWLIYALYFLYAKPKPKLAGLFLGLFAIGLISNAILSVILLATFLFGELLTYRIAIRSRWRSYAWLLGIFGMVTTLGYLIILVIPNGYLDVFGFQLGRGDLADTVRWEWLSTTVKANWPIFAFGLAGSLLYSKTLRLFGLFNIIGMYAVVFLGTNFYVHYVTILAPGLVISAAVLLAKLQKLGLGVAAMLILGLGIYHTSYANLHYQLLEKTTPEFFQAVAVLKDSPEPLFAFEPVYASYANKRLVDFRYMACMRYYRVLGTNLSDEAYIDILTKSNTVLIEPFAASMVTPQAQTFITENFRLVYQDTDQKIYVKNGMGQP